MKWLPLSLILTCPLISQADFPTPHDTETKLEAFLPPAEALKQFELPPGFQVTLSAAEPDVRNPIAMAWDHRGRLWIAECYTYGEFAFDLSLRDRILIFEDSTGDGILDKRSVFTEDLQQVTSIEIGHRGVWVIAAPHLLFIPDADLDDRPDREPIVHLTGFKVPPDSYHNLANGLRYGPDGWIYGRCGATGAADVGPPGTPEEDLIPVRGGMWRYHPTSHQFEAITSGNTNPWGHDWNEHGELFYVNTVNGHFWHVTPGAHFVRAHTLDPNPHAYTLIDTHADHWHFDTTLGWQDTARRKDANSADSLGGGHVHIGAMFYQATNWPAEYRGQFFTLNQHGRRANQENVVRHGSGYLAQHRPDFFKTRDVWFLGLDLRYGPDGSVYVIDWSDTGECHERDGVHRNSGRIYRIAYGQPQHTPIDLTQLSEPELVALHTHPNEWFPRQARVELSSRGPARDATIRALQDLYTQSQNQPVHQLRILWTLHAIGASNPAQLQDLLTHPNEHHRTWALRLLTDSWPLDTLTSQRPAASPAHQKQQLITPEELLPQLISRAQQDDSALVRLTLASILQRLPPEHRIPLARPLCQHQQDADDHNIPHMLWYGLIPTAITDPDALASLAADCAIPITRQHIARRLAEDIETNPAPLNQLLGSLSSRDAVSLETVLSGMTQAFTGWRRTTKPEAWDQLQSHIQTLPANSRLSSLSRELSTLFGDGRALDEIKTIVTNKDLSLQQRKNALQTLIDAAPPDLRSICEKLMDERYLNPLAAQGLARFDDDAAAQRLVKAYRKFHHTERHHLIETLASRPTYARALIQAVAAQNIPASALTAFHIRQLRSLPDTELQTQVDSILGPARSSSEDIQKRMADLQTELTPEHLASADKSMGRLLFNAACASCHRLHGHGGTLGPDLTGAGRQSLHYLLENILDPSAQVAPDYRLTLIKLKDGRLLSGIITTQSTRTLTLQTMAEPITLERDQIESIDASDSSIMPQGLIDSLNQQQIRDLIAYLMHPTQSPLPDSSQP